MNWKWFVSRQIRHATQMCRHVRKLRNAQQDLLSPAALEAIDGVIAESSQIIARHKNQQELTAQMDRLEAVALEHLKPYPNASLRENVEVLLVAIAVAMGIRTFFLQPFKIPTGSMQPTLFGITEENLIGREEVEIPNPFSRFFQYWIDGVSYTHVVAKTEGALNRASLPRKFLLFNLYQTFHIGPEKYTIWFPPENLLERAELVKRGSYSQKYFRKGEDVIKLKVVSGDHLFVDRLSYNFRRPRRGDIIVFKTAGISSLPQDQFYIKRLVALGGERVQIGNDRHLIVDGKRLDASTPRFELVYSFDGPPKSSEFSGHVNEVVGRSCGHARLARQFPNEDAVFEVRPNHYLVMGDNTLNSLDSRTWGDFPRENVIGQSYFVYWPIGGQDGRDSRFGWSHR